MSAFKSAIFHINSSAQSPERQLSSILAGHTTYYGTQDSYLATLIFPALALPTPRPGLKKDCAHAT